jgi:uncharacterized membrane protein
MEKARTALRWVLGVAMIAVGVLHFVVEPAFTSIVPPWVPFPVAMVLISGVAEIALGAGILVLRTRRLASYGLVALYLAVFPANIHMAINNVAPAGAGPVPAWAAWARLPFQLVFIAWALWVGREEKRQ